MHPRQTLGIPSVRLHPLAWLSRDHRRRHNRAIVSQGKDLSIQSIPGRPGLIAEVQDLITISNRIRRCVVLTEIADLASPPDLGYRHRISRLRGIDSYKCFTMFLHGSSSVR